MSFSLLKSRQESSRWVAFSVLIVSAALLPACSSSNSNSKVSAATRGGAGQPVQVTVASAQKQDLPIYITGLGSIQAYYTVSVKSRVDGQLVDVRFKEGQFVNKGELLAVIDPRPYQVALEQAQAQSFKDQATLRDAKLNYQRYKDLLQNSGAMSQQQVDTQQATVDQLEGAVRNDQAAVDSAKLNLAYCHITAPVSGRIGLRLVDPGNIVHASDANPMLVITELQPITAIFTLPEDQLPEVAQHMRKGPLEVDAYSRDDVTKLTTGKLLTIDNQIDQTTGTGRLKAVFENKESALWPNQFVNIHLLLETQKGVTVVPSAAVQHGPQGNYVYVMKPDQTVEVRQVNVSVTQGNLSAIASGLAPGDSVVTDGQDKLQQGSKVQPHMQGAGASNASNTGGNEEQGQNQSSANAQPNTNEGQARRNHRNGPPTQTGNQNRGTASQ
ncbi:MAG TPA: MdtA/MuxA family multidrug efflux RND transporter periplasmic adaptor subunit [Terriglobales bacterium]|nr:MdtA/MuxA family multidrug efflux RND transporter periplasmic adaptor subunit [Terriglobales bacterium]